MMRLTSMVYTAMLSLALVNPAGAESASDTNYTLFVAIRSDPQDILLTSTADVATTLGRTPCVIKLDVSWTRKWNGLRWRTAQVQSPGQSCRVEFDKSGACHLMLSFEASKPGFKTQRFEVEAATLKAPGFFWSGRDEWPLKNSLQVELQSEQAATSAPAPDRPSTVVIARDVTGKDMGRILVTANVEEAEVYLDDARVGVTPLNLLLQPGAHRLQIRKDGFTPFTQSLSVEGGTDGHLKARLEPQPQEQ